MAKRRARGTGPTMIQRSREKTVLEKAGYAMGEGRVDRIFFELSSADEEAIYARVEAVLDAHVNP